MPASQRTPRDPCQSPNCKGVQVPGGYCLAHANPGARDDALKEFSETGQLDARGVPVTPDLLRRILEAAPSTDGRPTLGDVDFSWAVFKGDAVFDETVLGKVDFGHATFEGLPGFYGVTFEDTADFMATTFEETAVFNHSVFQRQAWFSSATFRNAALFVDVRFWERASFLLATFEGTVAFDGASLRQGAEFDRASFRQPVDLGPLAVAGRLSLDRVVFDHPVHLEVAAWRLSCRRTRFRAGGHLRVAWAEVSLEGAEIPVPLILSAQQADRELVSRVQWLDERGDQQRDFPAPMPSLVSVLQADVAGLVVADIDLHECRYAGAHHLDQLQVTTIDQFSTFQRAPVRWGKGRRVLAEECEWRQRRAGRRARRWRQTTSALFCSPLLEGARRRPRPGELAGIYRQLRKGREDAKNEPGAADFYWGECEMRRHSAATPRVERAILWLYWLVSGYGLRAWRALATFLVVLVVAAGLFAFGGGFAPSTSAAGTSPTAALATFTGPPSTATTAVADTSFGGALAYIARTVIGLTREPQPRLTRLGDAVQILLRVLGPLLLGLAVLSVRGRVKR